MPAYEDSVTNTESKTLQERIVEKLLRRKSSDRFLKPFLQELNRISRPYIWLLVGVYLSLILPIGVLMVLLINAHSNILRLCNHQQ